MINVQGMLVSAMVSGSFFALGWLAHAHSRWYMLVTVAWFFIVGFLVSLIFPDEYIEEELELEIDLETGEWAMGKQTQNKEPTMEEIADMIRSHAAQRKVSWQDIMAEYQKALEESEDDRG